MGVVMLCRFSRLICWLLTGQWLMLCTVAHVLCWRRTEATLDLILARYDGPRHCERMARAERMHGPTAH